MATGECILVVDDDKEIRETLVKILREGGCQAEGAENGRVALDKLHQAQSTEHTCLILLDLMMPVMDGVTFRQEQLNRSELAGIPVIVVSAFDEVAEMKAAGYLKKPVQLSDILRTAERYCACDLP